MWFVRLGIKSVLYDPANPLVVTITPALKWVFPNGLILVVSGTAPAGLHDMAGDLLDGDRDGKAGGDMHLQIS